MSIYKVIHKERDSTYVNEHQPYFIVKVPTIETKDLMVYYHNFEVNCREILIDQLQERINHQPTLSHVGDENFSIEGSLPAHKLDSEFIHAEIYTNPFMGENIVVNTEQFYKAMNNLIVPFTLLFWSDDDTRWFLSYFTDKQKIIKGQPVYALHPKIFYDPNVISLFTGLWRCAWVTADTEWGTKLANIFTKEEITNLLTGSSSDIKNACRKVAKVMAEIWECANNGYSPIHQYNIDKVNEFIGSSKTKKEQNFKINQYHPEFFKGKIESNYYDGSKEFYFNYAGYDFGFDYMMESWS